MDTVLSPNGVESSTYRAILVPGLGAVAPVGGLTPAEVAALRADVAAVMGIELADLPDVDMASIADGQYLTWNATTLKMEPASIVNGIRIRDTAAVIVSETAADITFRFGLTATQSGTRTYVTPVYGSSGSQNVVARADHAHPPTLVGRLTFDKAGAVLGAGTTDLINTSVSGLISGVTYDVTLAGEIEAVNTNLSGRIQLNCKIGSTGAVQSVSRGCSGGVWTPLSLHGSRMTVTGVTSLDLLFTAEYQSGDPTALYTGYLAYSITPRGGTS